MTFIEWSWWISPWIKSKEVSAECTSIRLELQQVNWHIRKSCGFCAFIDRLCHLQHPPIPLGCQDLICPHFSIFAFEIGLWLSRATVHLNFPLLSHVISFPICANVGKRGSSWVERMAGLFLVWWAWLSYKAAVYEVLLCWIQQDIHLLRLGWVEKTTTTESSAQKLASSTRSQMLVKDTSLTSQRNKCNILSVWS